MPMSSVLKPPLLLVSVFLFGAGSNLPNTCCEPASKSAQQDLVLRGVVAGGLGERQAIGGVVRHANAVIVGLNALVALAVDARVARR